MIDGFVVGELHGAIEPRVVRVEPRRREYLLSVGSIAHAGGFVARVCHPVLAPGVRDEGRDV
jgi:hypothetical protein